MRRAAAKASLLSLLTLAGTPASAGDRLSGEEIKRLVTGRVGSWTTADGRYSGTTLHRPSGILSSKVKLFGQMKDIPGTWEVKGDRFCRSVPMDLVRTRCQSVVRSGNSYQFINENGKLATVSTFR